MQCRACGTEIADKAIVCFRCGAATTDPVRRPVPVGWGRNPLISLAIAAVLVLLGLYLGQASRTAAEAGWLQMGAGALVLAAAAVLIVRIIRRR